MKVRLIRYWEQVRGSYWFIPGLMSFGAVALAAGLGFLDMMAQAQRYPGLESLYVTGPSGARAVLSTIAGSAITVAGVVFSITVVVLNMASAQFGPRLLRNFMEHGGTQLTLGTFIGTFIYCLLVLSTVRSDGGHVYVPHISVGAGVLLGVISFLLLIYFVHHVSIFIQAPRIIDDVVRNLEHALRSSFPERGEGAPAPTPDEEAEQAEALTRESLRPGCVPVATPGSGYVQAVDLDGLLSIAEEKDLFLRLRLRAGQFAVAGRAVAEVAPAATLDQELAERIAGAYLIGPERTPTQDPEFAVNQLVELALRALSPGINDPFSAINCIERLGSSLALLAGRTLPSRFVRDQYEKVRIITEPYTYRGIVDAAFNQIRQGARCNAAVIFRLLEIIRELGKGDLPRPYRDALRDQCQAIYELGQDCFPSKRDWRDFEDRYQSATAVLKNTGH